MPTRIFILQVIQFLLLMFPTDAGLQARTVGDNANDPGVIGDGNLDILVIAVTGQALNPVCSGFIILHDPMLDIA